MFLTLINSATPQDKPIRVDAVTVLTLKRNRLREVDLGSLSLDSTLLMTMLPLTGIIIPYFIDEETVEPKMT